MNVNKWGPGGWEFLHSITFNYPLDPIDTDKENYRIFFNQLKIYYHVNIVEIHIKYITNIYQLIHFLILEKESSTGYIKYMN